MRFLTLLGVCTLLVSVKSSNVLVDELLHDVDATVQNLKDQLGEALEKELSNLLNLGSTFGKRDLFSSVLDVSKLLDQEGDNIKNVSHSYVNTVHGLYNKLHHLDAKTFISALENAVAKHSGMLDGIVHQFNKGLAHIAVTGNNKRDLLGLFGGLAQQFQTAVAGLKQTLGGGATGTTGGTDTGGTGTAGSLLTSVTSHLEHFGQTLSHLKETGAGLLASGQEAVDALKNSAANLFHQAVNGAQGQASQVVDTLLHPASN